MAILVFLLLGLCVSAPARQTPAPPAGPRIKLTVRLSREGKLDAVTGADFYLIGAARPPAYAVWDVPIKLDRDQVPLRLDSSNAMAASRANDAN